MRNYAVPVDCAGNLRCLGRQERMINLRKSTRIATGNPVDVCVISVSGPRAEITRLSLPRCRAKGINRLEHRLKQVSHDCLLVGFFRLVDLVRSGRLDRPRRDGAAEPDARSVLAYFVIS